jgi:MFS family permease
MMTRNAAIARSAVLLGAGGLAQSLALAGIAPGISQMAPVLAPGPQGVILAQTVMTVPGLAMLVMAPIIGIASERLGYRPTLLVGLVIFTIAGMAGLVITSPWLLIASRFVLGAAGAAVLTPTMALVSYYFDGTARERLLGLMAGAAALTAIVAATVAGAMVAALGWRAPFTLFAVAAIPLIAAVPIITDHDGHRTAIKPPPAVAGEKPPLGALVGIYALGCWMAMVSLSTTVQAPFLLAQRGMQDPRLVSLIINAVTVAMIIAAPFYGKLAVRFGSRSIFALILGLLGLGNVVIGALTPFAAIIVGSALIGVASAYIPSSCNSYVFANVPASAHGRAIGGLIGAMFLGTFINQFVMYPVNATIGIAPGFVFIGVLNVIGALIALMLPLFRRRLPVVGES